ncbi:MAG: XisI protein [bacterium]|nr:XisI protein [bacterium]
MDTLSNYSRLIREVLAPYAEIEYSNVNSEIRNQLITDEENGHYLILSMGWAERPRRRIHGCLIHIAVIDGMIWIQRDGTEGGIAGELEEAGIPKEKIVLGFHDPRVRQYTDYAAA